MYIFWPKSLQRVIVKKCKCCQRKPSKSDAPHSLSTLNHDEFDKSGKAAHGDVDYESGDEDIYDDSSSGDGDGEEGEKGGHRKKKNKKGYDKDEDEYYQTIR